MRLFPVPPPLPEEEPSAPVTMPVTEANWRSQRTDDGPILRHHPRMRTIFNHVMAAKQAEKAGDLDAAREATQRGEQIWRDTTVERDIQPDELSKLRPNQHSVLPGIVQGYVKDPDTIHDTETLDPNDLPVIYRKQGEDPVVMGGHHRVTAAKMANRPVRARVFDESEYIPQGKLFTENAVGGLTPWRSNDPQVDEARQDIRAENPADPNRRWDWWD